MPTNISPLWLLAMAGAAGYCIIGLSVKSGFLAGKLGGFMAEHPDLMPRDVPGAADPLRRSYTGVKPIDDQLRTVMPFFWPLLKGDDPAATVFAFWAAGQVVCVHGLLMLESMRGANKGRLLTYITVWGLIYQNVPFGIVLPLWVALWLATSPARRFTWQTPHQELEAGLAVDSIDLHVLPHALILGYVLPTVLVCLPSPAITTPDQQQIYLAIWQAFPLWVGLAHAGLSRLMRATGAESRMKQDRHAVAARLRWVYAFLLIVTAGTHLATLNYVFMPGLRPNWAATSAPINWRTVWQPRTLPVGPVKTVETFAEGAQALLHYDVYFAGGALLLWAAQGFWNASDDNAPSLASILNILAGPAGAAAVLMWRRDEMLLMRERVPKVKTR